jgi:pyruvate/2-oxoglutarate dehydrogenase complex dihydrolipoamide acyltransferase (E2) component
MYLDMRLPHFFGEKAPVTMCEWHKQLGQSVSVGDPLATVLCAGKTLRVKSTSSGVLVHRRIADGEWIFTGSVFAVLSEREAADKAKPQDNKGTRQRRSQHTGNSQRETSQARTADTQRAWHEVLELPPTADIADIRIAYRRKIGQYHPDRVANLGPELRAMAERLSKEINLAYEEARKTRRL